VIFVSSWLCVGYWFLVLPGSFARPSRDILSVYESEILHGPGFLRRPSHFGVKLFYFQTFDLRGIDEVIADAVIFYEIVACIGVSFGVWALYNYARFKNLERRKALPSVTTGQLAVFFGVEEQQIAELQDAQRISIQFDEQANMVACRAMEQAEAKPAE